MASAAKRKKKASSRKNSRSAAPAIRQALARLTFDQKLGQLLMVYVWGRFTSADDPRLR